MNNPQNYYTSVTSSVVDKSGNVTNYYRGGDTTNTKIIDSCCFMTQMTRVGDSSSSASSGKAKLRKVSKMAVPAFPSIMAASRAIL